MSPHADINVVLSMLYQRGERTNTNGIRTFTRAQADRVVSAYNLRENRTAVTVREVTNASTNRWVVDSTLEPDRFLLCVRQPVG